MSKRKKQKNQKTKLPKRKQLSGPIMSIFRENSGQSLNYKQVSSRLDLSSPAGRQAVLSELQALKAMDLLKEVERGKFSLHPDQIATLVGSMDFTKSGSAYMIPEGGGADVYISEKNTKLALHGDRVEVILTKKSRGQFEGRVERVVERVAESFVGVIEISDKHAFFVPSNPRIHVDFYVDHKKLNGAKNGQKVIVKMLDWTDDQRSPFAEVIDVLGEPGDNEVEMHAILVEFGLPYEFPKAVLEAADKIPTKISQKEIDARRDMRTTTTFTIDPEDAKDFDDALSIRSLGDDQYEVGIHIADVSHYVKPGDIIDQEAVKRATSVYLVDRVVPMLPEVLSNMVCSLRPDEDKLCMSAVFNLNSGGKILKSWFGRTIIRSDRRFTYEEAQKVIESGKGDFSSEILRLNNWARSMRKKRMQSGAIEFGGAEIKFKLDEKGKPVGVYQKVMKEANWLIEEFMLLANKRVAEHIGIKKKDERPKTFVYRIHDLPDPEKLKVLKDFVARMGYRLSSTDPEKASRALNQLMDAVKGKAEEEIVKQMAIRSMAKAVYSTENIGHYGLGFSHYTHFTSPIRRYPDVMAHRLLEDYKNGAKSADSTSLEKSCKHSSNMEKRASDAERASIKYKQVEYMLDKIGEVFYGNISGLTRWGMFVALEENKCEGMIPLNTMDDDIYRYDEKKNRIEGVRYKEVYEFGDRVKVLVKGADLLQKQLDFRIV